VLRAAADKLRAQMDAAEYKQLALGLIFLKYISDTFVEHQQKVLEMAGEELMESASKAPAAEVAASSCWRRAAALAVLGLELWG
jgi:type I restriction-modification system DNA methylase subunit